MLFIINEQANILNMARTAPTAYPDAYQAAIQKWMPKAEIRLAPRRLARFDGVVRWRTALGAIRYLVEEKRHFRHQDVAVIAGQLNQRRADLPAEHAADRLLLLAPHVRPQQAVALERAQIDYLDLAGNAHLEAPGLFVHVEGRQPPKAPPTGPARPHRGWIKIVMAILIRPDLINAPYRTLAAEADVALGTIAACMHDLAIRGLLTGRRHGGRVADRQALVALWVQAYIEGLRPRLAERRFQVRAADKPEIWQRLRTALGERGQPWALTGADAAERHTHFFHADETEIYAPLQALDVRDVQKAIVAQPATRGGNLLVIEPPGPLAIPTTVDAVTLAPDLLAYAELRYRGTGQALEAADLLLPRVLGNGAH
jgi:hypothetical protein